MAPGQKVGYVRVSSIDQNADRQLDGIAVDKAFTDYASGSTTDRPELATMLDYVRDGDTIICHSMDRLARNLSDLRKLVDDLTGKGIKIQFLKESLTFTGDDSAMSKLLLSVMGAVAEFERSLILERQREGIAIAKAKGVYKGKQPKLKPDQVQALRDKIASGAPKAQTARDFGISRSTLYQYIS